MGNPWVIAGAVATVLVGISGWIWKRYEERQPRRLIASVREILETLPLTTDRELRALLETELGAESALLAKRQARRKAGGLQWYRIAPVIFGVGTVATFVIPGFFSSRGFESVVDPIGSDDAASTISIWVALAISVIPIIEIVRYERWRGRERRAGRYPRRSPVDRSEDLS